MESRTENEFEWKEVYNPDEGPFFRRKFYCGKCGDWQTYGKTHYCMWCGAKMKMNEKEAEK